MLSDDNVGRQRGSCRTRVEGDAARSLLHLFSEYLHRQIRESVAGAVRLVPFTPGLGRGSSSRRDGSLACSVDLAPSPAQSRHWMGEGGAGNNIKTELGVWYCLASLYHASFQRTGTKDARSRQMEGQRLMKSYNNDCIFQCIEQRNLVALEDMLCERPEYS